MGVSILTGTDAGDGKDDINNGGGVQERERFSMISVEGVTVLNLPEITPKSYFSSLPQPKFELSWRIVHFLMELSFGIFFILGELPIILPLKKG